MSACISRREFTALGAAAALAWPLAARGQQATIPVVGFMSARSPEDSAHLVAAFRRGLGEGGFVEGQNVALEFRWARGQYDRLPALAAELVSRGVAVLVAVGGDPSPVAAKQATSIIPIVFGIGDDPVKAGLVESFNRPGGNVTGITLMTALMEPKRLGLLRELVPGVPLIGVLLNPLPARCASTAGTRAGGAYDWSADRHQERQHRRGTRRRFRRARPGTDWRTASRS
jgi:putative ABC transport system substrate-binding protein